jgi:hypothetical protein
MVSIFFIGCLGPEEKILGTWRSNTMENFYFTFMENEELNVNDQIFMKYNFTPDKKKLVLGEEEPVPFTLKGNTLQIHQQGLDITLTNVKRLEKRR